MNSKFSRIVVLIVLAAMLVAGCAPQATEVPSTVFKVAIVMPSSITDMAFSQSMYEGLKKVQAEMGGESAMEIAYSENMFKVPDAAAAIRDYASKGYNLVIAHGSQYGTSLQQIAPDFPKTAFAWGTSLDTFQAEGINNVFAYQAEAQEGGYVLGVVAAMMSSPTSIRRDGPVDARRCQAVHRRLPEGRSGHQTRCPGQHHLHRLLLGRFIDGHRG